jgi:hypothetical protein
MKESLENGSFSQRLFVSPLAEISLWLKKLEI